MTKPLNSKSNYKTILNRLIVLIVLLAIGYAIYSGFFTNAKAGKSTADSNVAYNFTLSDLEGNDHNLTDYLGKGVVVNFWATYCPPCEKEMPYIENAYQDYKNQGVEVLAINVEEPMRIANLFISEKNVSFPVLLDRYGKTSQAYEVINLPVTFFINAEGEIVERISGEMTEEMIRENMEKIKPEI